MRKCVRVCSEVIRDRIGGLISLAKRSPRVFHDSWIPCRNTLLPFLRFRSSSDEQFFKINRGREKPSPILTRAPQTIPFLLLSFFYSSSSFTSHKVKFKASIKPEPGIIQRHRRLSGRGLGNPAGGASWSRRWSMYELLSILSTVNRDEEGSRLEEKDEANEAEEGEEEEDFLKIKLWGSNKGNKRRKIKRGGRIRGRDG